MILRILGQSFILKNGLKMQSPRSVPGASRASTSWSKKRVHRCWWARTTTSGGRRLVRFDVSSFEAKLRMWTFLRGTSGFLGVGEVNDGCLLYVALCRWQTLGWLRMLSRSELEEKRLDCDVEATLGVRAWQPLEWYENVKWVSQDKVAENHVKSISVRLGRLGAVLGYLELLLYGFTVRPPQFPSNFEV